MTWFLLEGAQSKTTPFCYFTS